MRLFRKRPEPEKPGWTGEVRGPYGPWSSGDRPEFYHADEEAIKWFLRLDKEEVLLLRAAARLIYWAQQAGKWGKRLFWCFTSGLAAALAAGENLQKLPGMISGVLETLGKLF